MSDSKTASKEPQEPSMEEILSSIRQIIASDEEPGGKSETPADAAAAKGEQPEEEDVLELTEVVPAEQPAAEKPEPKPEAKTDSPPEPEPEAKTESPPEPKNEPEAKPGAEAKPPPAAEKEAEKEAEQAPPPDLAAVEQEADRELAAREADLELVENEAPDAMPSAKEETTVADDATEEEALISGEAAEAATGAFAKLARSVARPEPEPVAAGDGKTVEQLVAELMRPMLKEWLDQNLPAIVERVVEREVRKLARRAELL